MNRLSPFFLAVALFYSTAFISSASASDAAADSANAAIHQRMQSFVDDGTVAGAVTLVARHDRIVSLDAVGYADLATKKPMRPDSMFWIASMTKPITATAVMMLQDEGKLNVEDPVEKYLPEFKNQWLIAEDHTNELKLVRSPRPIKLRDLLTHTSGVSGPNAPRYDSTLAEMVMAYSQTPLQFPPGSKWKYSTPGMNTLGRIVEVASGESYAVFLQKRIFDPLKMKDTTFWPTPRQAKRLAKSYKHTNNGLEEIPIAAIKGDLSDHRRMPIPAGGLFSTASDIARFYQMMLSGGALDGKRILSAESLALMTRIQTGDLKTGFSPGMSWGLGVGVVKEPTGVTGTLSPGTFGHGGAYATQSWADPKKDLIMILMIQRTGFEPNGDQSPLRKALQETAVATVKD
jgi:CubicO group peptidase (beta-lactamase class C family)